MGIEPKEQPSLKSRRNAIVFVLCVVAAYSYLVFWILSSTNPGPYRDAAMLVGTIGIGGATYRILQNVNKSN